MPEDLLRRLEARYSVSGRFQVQVRRILRSAPLTPSVRRALEATYRREAEMAARVLENRQRLAEIQRDVVRAAQAQRRCQTALADLDTAARELEAQHTRLRQASSRASRAVDRLPLISISDDD